MILRIGGDGIMVSRWRSAVVVSGTIGMRVRCNVSLRFVYVSGWTIISQTMRNASKRDRGVRRKHTKCVKRGETERRTHTKSLPQHSAHRVIKNKSEETSE